MDQYQKVEKPKAETPLNENELRIIVQGRNELSLEMTTPSVKKNNLMIGVVISVAFKTQINSWNSSIYSTGSSGAVRV
uniref:Uncharacterized protein n=1 Tax=Gossypium raimondii TaxID=29730 RepID=A0A0D2Q178_GOSRA|nr:hypothetical protein B456_002G057000 [Gossypium raimondii]